MLLTVNFFIIQTFLSEEIETAETGSLERMRKRSSDWLMNEIRKINRLEQDQGNFVDDKMKVKRRKLIVTSTVLVLSFELFQKAVSENLVSTVQCSAE